MRFKEWLKLDEVRFKGYWRQYKKDMGNKMPAYVAKDIYNSRIGHTMHRFLNPLHTGDAPTGPMPQQSYGSGTGPMPMATSSGTSFVPSGYNRTADSPTPSDLPSRILKSSSARGIHWMPHEVIVPISPQNLDKATLNDFINRQFGHHTVDPVYDEKGNVVIPGIMRDGQRTAVQRQLMQDRGEGNNEPILLIRRGNQYEAFEGRHRLMQYMLAYSAPPEDQQALERGEIDKLNFANWTPVSIKAFIGIPEMPQRNTTYGGNASNIGTTAAMGER